MSATTCFNCGQPHERAGQRNCRDCHNAYQREWRKKFVRVPREAYDAMVAELARFRCEAERAA